MQTRNVNFMGSNDYFHMKRMDLESLIEHKGMITLWFDLLAAGNHYLDLNKMICGDRPMSASANEKQNQYEEVI